MPGRPTRTADEVRVSIARDPALVRTVRLVAAAVARRAGRDEEFVEEVRLAVGEACALMVGDGSSGRIGSDDAVTVAMALDEQLQVDVVATGPGNEPPGNVVLADVNGIEPWALLRALIDDVKVVHNGATTMVSMAWPVG